MLWQTIRAYFLPSAHPGVRPVREKGGEEFRPKVDEWGRRVEEGDWASVWEGHQADRIREQNRAVVRPFMGRYIRRWAVLAGVLWAISQAFGGLGLTLAAWVVLGGSVAAGFMVVMLVLLRQEVQS